MGCSSCGGNRAVGAGAGHADVGQPVVWRVERPRQSPDLEPVKIDMWSQQRAQEEQAKVPGSILKKIDPRTGEEIA